MKLMPMVRGIKRKWYIAVKANCRRERSITSSESILASLVSFWGSAGFAYY
jgi:hypothetical protein